MYTLDPLDPLDPLDHRWLKIKFVLKKGFFGDTSTNLKILIWRGLKTFPPPLHLLRPIIEWEFESKTDYGSLV